MEISFTSWSVPEKKKHRKDRAFLSESHGRVAAGSRCYSKSIIRKARRLKYKMGEAQKSILTACFFLSISGKKGCFIIITPFLHGSKNRAHGFAKVTESIGKKGRIG